MNTKNLTSDKRLLAMILGVAIIATVGVSFAYAQTAGTTSGTNSQTTAPPQIQGSVNLKQMLLSSIKTKFTDAANTAAGAVTNGQVIGGNLAVIQGSVVYNFKVFDGTNIYSVIVDAGNGNLLNTSQGHPFQMGSLFGMGHSGMMHKFHMKGYAPQPVPQQTQPQSDQQSSPENAPLGT